MKKYLLFIVMMIIFVQPVCAEETSINIIELKQGDIVLEQKDNMYVANSLDYVTVSFRLNNYDTLPDKYYIYIKNNYSSPSMYESYSDTGEYVFSLPSFNSDIEEYFIKVCSDMNCNSEYASTSFYINNPKYKEMLNGKIYITSIRQGGKEIVPDSDFTFTFNNRQDIYFTIKGENLMDNYEYTINDGEYDDMETYFGSVLEEGVTYILNPNNKGDFYLDYSVGMFYMGFMYKDTDTDFGNYYRQIISDDNFGDYEANLIYTNNKKIEIEKYNLNNKDFYIVNKKYYDSNNTLSYKINGTNYQDRDYNIKLDVKENSRVVYTKSIDVNGLLLNNGYEFELTNLLLESGKTYTFYLEIDGISNKTNIKYIENEISVRSITQNEKELTLKNNTYIVDELKGLNVRFNFDNIENYSSYYIMVNTSEYSIVSYSSNENLVYINPNNINKEEYEYTVMVCSDWECNELYAVNSFKIKYTFYQELKNSKVIISNLKQAGKTIELDEDWRFNINRSQNITYTIKGENLFKDKYYSFSNGLENIKYLGSEVEKGIDFTYYINNYWPQNFRYQIEDIYFDDFYYYDGSTYYHSGEENKYIYYNVTDEVIHSFTIELIDKNNNTLEFIDADEYNKDKTLNLMIKGKNFKNKNYNISINIIHNNNSIYKENKTVSGNLLNNNYKYTLKNIDFESTYSRDKYQIYVTIDDATYFIDTKYKYNGYIYLTPYYGDKELPMNFNGFGSGGGYRDVVMVGYVVNPNIINDKITLKYSGVNFVESREYDYEISYTANKMDDYSIDNSEVVKTGKISGADLMDDKLKYDIYLNKNLDKKYIELYTITIKYNNKFIMEHTSIFQKDSIPMITSFKIKYNNKELENKNEEYQLIKENDDIILEFKGEGFEDDKDYYFNFDSVSSNDLIEGDTLTKLITKEITIKGQELNDGYSYTIHYDDSDKYRRINYGIKMNKNSASIDRGDMYINYVNYNDFIKDLDRYNIEDSIFKYVNKNTRVLDLINRIKLYDNATLKVFDKTNTTEINNIVGTGMILKLYNNDNNLFDFKIVVKGDVNGDGNISVTDLVKVKKHLSYKNRLTDIYELAGDVTSDGNISITDLVRMAKDVSEIESLS